jgi:hypothetical protein
VPPHPRRLWPISLRWCHRPRPSSSPPAASRSPSTGEIRVAVNGHFWVFYASLTDLEYTLRVRDHETSTERVYVKPPLLLRSGSDTQAF